MVCVRPDDLVSHTFLRLSLSTQRAIPLLIDHHTVASTGGLEPVRTLNETVAIQPRAAFKNGHFGRFSIVRPYLEESRHKRATCPNLCRPGFPFCIPL